MTAAAAAGGRRLVVEADGGSRGNPGPAGYGALVRDAGTGEVLAELAESIGSATNNVAEYRGLIAGLRLAIGIDPGCTVEVRMDSKLVVEQMSGRWQIKHDGLRQLAARARGILPPARVRYTWVPRARNVDADRLANAAMDAAAAGRAWTRTAGAVGVADLTGPSGGPDPAGLPSTAVGSVRAPRAGESGEPTTLVLIRHGRTPLTEAGRFSGRDGEDPELSEAGRQDAALAAEVVAGLGRPGALLPDLAAPAAIVTSPMLRTRQTAEAVRDRLAGVRGRTGDAGSSGPIVDEEWIEAGFGAWEGLTYAELERSHREQLRSWQGSMDVAPPGGESLRDVIDRVRRAQQRVLASHSGKTVVVVTHATPVRVVLQQALDAGPAAMWRLRITPGALTAVRFWDDAAEVVTVNATAHLAR